MKTIQELLASQTVASAIDRLVHAKHYIFNEGEVQLPPNRKEIQLALTRSIIALYCVGFTLDDTQTKHNIREAISRIHTVTSCLTLPDIGIGIRPSGRRFHVPLHRLVDAYLLSRTVHNLNTDHKRLMTLAIGHLIRNLGKQPMEAEFAETLSTTACMVSTHEPLVARSLYWMTLIVHGLNDVPVESSSYPPTSNPHWFIRRLPNEIPAEIPVSHAYLLYLYLMEAQQVKYIALTEAYRRTTLGSLNHRINQLPPRMLLAAIERADHSMLTPFELAVVRREDE